MNCTNPFQGMVQGVTTRQGITSPITIGDSCIVEIDEHFFLLVKILFNDTERAVVLRISRSQAADLIRSGVRNCSVLNTFPLDIQGRVDLLAIFTVRDFAFLVFETERAVESLERLFVVRFPLSCIINGEPA